MGQPFRRGSSDPADGPRSSGLCFGSLAQPISRAVAKSLWTVIHPPRKTGFFYGCEGLLPFDSAINAQVSLLLSLQIKRSCPSGHESASA